LFFVVEVEGNILPLVAIFIILADKVKCSFLISIMYNLVNNILS